MTPTPLEEARRLATLAADESHDNGSIENATRSIAAALLAREKAVWEEAEAVLRKANQNYAATIISANAGAK